MGAVTAIQNTCNTLCEYVVPVGDYILQLVAKVIEAIGDFFATCYEFLTDFCCEDEPPEPARPQLQFNWRNLHQQPLPDLDWNRFDWNRPVQPVFQQNRAHLQWDFPQPAEMEGEGAWDMRINQVPVDLEALKLKLERGERVDAISERMTASQFAELCRDYPIQVEVRNQNRELVREFQVQKMEDVETTFEGIIQEVRAADGDDEADGLQLTVKFPPERVRIGKWAEKWGESKTIRIDPEHPYFEIFQEAFRLKAQIQGGQQADGNFANYSVEAEDYLNNSKFQYIIKSLIGFQELSREENRNLMKLLDNYSPNNGQNFAYNFARSISKILCYPTNGQGDVKNKLQIGCEAPMLTFTDARAQGKILEYFQRAFGEAWNNLYCFDIRVETQLQFRMNLDNPFQEDFDPRVVATDGVEQKILKHYGAFRNRQILEMSRAHNRIGYQAFKRIVDLGEENEDTRLFYRQFCTKERFSAYLEEGRFPIKEKPVPQPGAPLPPLLPIPAEWEGGIPTVFKTVPLNLIPENRRQVGAVLGIQDPKDYIAIVARRVGRFFLSFSRQAPRPGLDQVRLENYNVNWHGLEEAEIAEDLLPNNARANQARVILKDPATYQVKVHAIQHDSAIIDFRGEPITRQRWQAVLNDDEYWR